MHSPRTWRLFTLLTPLLTALLLMSGCGEDPLKPDDLIPEAHYTDLLTDLFLQEKLISLTDMEERQDSLREELFEAYEVSLEQFERSHIWYQRQARDQLARIDTIQSRLRAERDTVESIRIKQIRAGSSIR